MVGADRVGARLFFGGGYHKSMERFDPFASKMSDEDFYAYLRLCQEIYLDLERTGHWPWSIEDSPNPENLLDSDSS